MKTTCQYLFIALITASLAVIPACKTDEPVKPNEKKPKVENLVVTPTSDLKYGDKITVSANLSDEVGLRMYTIQMSNSTGSIYSKSEMLTGKAFTLNLELPIPLPKNAVAGDMKIAITVKNSGNQLATAENVIKNLALPSFEQLYLIINSTAFPMIKNGDVYETEDFFPAEAKGKIYANPDKSGLYWGEENAEIKALGANDIVIGKDEEKFFKVSFNPVSFTLTMGNPQDWKPMDESLYIYGDISGHWADGEIKEEKKHVKMKGLTLGNWKMWTWTPPNTGSEKPGDDMWGNIKAGQFRFKKAGKEEYITYSAGQIVTGADNKANSFVITDGGNYTFKIFANSDNAIQEVRMDNGNRRLVYKNDGIYINGTKAGSAITFAGSSLTLKPGHFFAYEGTLNLNKDQSISASGVDLRQAFCDPDVFTGKGNSTWSCIQASGEYYVCIDAFSGNIYIRNNKGYPDAIYMDGWSWGKFKDNAKGDWEPSSRLTLYKTGTGNVYEGQLYIYPWGGDVSFFAAPAIEGSDFAKREIFGKYFENVLLNGNNVKFPEGLAEGYYKVSVDLKDGFTFDTAQQDGTTTNYLLLPTNNKKFTVKFTPL